ncbi:MAG: OmpA family protein [Candidatus Eisenbacteria sp.]|nr:OmpA family protein [Candidatus Eisenbacteria bacterium]
MRRICVSWTILSLALCGLAFCGCFGSHRSAQPLMADFQRYEREAQELAPSAAAPAVLQAGQGKRDRARSLIEQGKDEAACTLLELAICDARLALALALADAAHREADHCLRVAEHARHQWNEALSVLRETERLAQRKIGETPHEIPGMDEVVLPAFPPTTLGTDAPLEDSATNLRATWEDWSNAATRHGISLADLEARFILHLGAAADKRADREDRSRQLHMAGRTLQELEARVRREVSQRVCTRAVALTAQLGDARDDALHATLLLERGLKGDLRAQLGKARAEAEDRQNQLFDALQQLEGKIARISRDARGTIVSLADILFDFDQATLKRGVELNLVRVATIVNQFPEMRILVEGHTDNVGTPEYNLDLSQRRAAAVYDFLDSQGVSAGRMTVQGYGMSRPMADNSTDEGRQKNRRVDLVIQEAP